MPYPESRVMSPIRRFDDGACTFGECVQLEREREGERHTHHTKIKSRFHNKNDVSRPRLRLTRAPSGRRVRVLPDGSSAP
jgi:hypothetical protein